jgi:hypothetical protein
VHAAVEDVEEGDWEDVGGVGSAGFEAEEFIKRDFL